MLLISCPDRKGLVAVISDFVFRHDGNILHADEHRDAETNLFLMRVEFDPTGMDVSLDELAEEFAPIAARFEMRWRLAKGKRRPRMGILVSQYDHCLADLLYRHKAGELDCDIPLVISNHTEAERLAGFYGAKFVHTPVTRETKLEVERQQVAMLREHDCDVVVLARYMQILSPAFLAEFPNQVINIHHSFLPAFVGARPYHQAFERGVKLIGATSHYVTEVLDEGPIIEQQVLTHLAPRLSAGPGAEGPRPGEGRALARGRLASRKSRAAVWKKDSGLRLASIDRRALPRLRE